MNSSVILACREPVLSLLSPFVGNPFFLIKCFGIGIGVATAVGPIFVLTFNRAASRGWWAGFTTGLGSALADACYFSLGLLGVLQIVTRSPLVLSGLYLVGGCVLVFMGSHLFRAGLRTPADKLQAPRYFTLMSQAFGMTIVNPTVLLFFITVSARVLGAAAAGMDSITMVMAVAALCAGSCTVYAATSTIGCIVGHKLPTWLLQRISQVVGLAVGFFGLFLIVSSLL